MPIFGQANQAALGQAGLPIPDGFCSTPRPTVFRLPLDLEVGPRRICRHRPSKRQHALRMKLESADSRSRSSRRGPARGWRALVARTGEPTVVRSSALVEDRDGANFAGQFESYLGIEHESEFLTAVRACWAALWSTRALRYMATHDLDPADTAMAVLVQPLVAAKAAGGGLSRTATGEMVVTATWGLGSSIAQGEVTPDRFELSLEGELLHVAIGQKDHRVGCTHRTPATQAVPRALATKACLEPSQVADIARLLRRAEEVQGAPVEIEWALDESGFKLLQARPLCIHPAHVPDEIWRQHPRVSGHPAGLGRGRLP